MRAFFLLFLLSCTVHLLYAQSTHDFYYNRYDYRYDMGDTSVEITIKPVYSHYTFNDFPCLTAENRESYFYKTDTLEKDSIQQLFKKLAGPIVGKHVAENTFVESMQAYNEQEPFFLDSARYARMSARYPECLELHYIFTCYFKFNNGIYFPYQICFDKKGRAIHASSILKTFKSLKSYQLIAPQKAYHKMINDRYFGEEQIQNFFTLKYSEQLWRFYFEVESTEGEVINETDYSYTLNKKHLFIDALTGEVLWRAKAEHFRKSIGCIDNYEVTYPTNTLTGN